MKKILVIDDSAIHQASARETLKDSGYELTIASGYREAYKLLLNPDGFWKHVETELGTRGLKWGVKGYQEAAREVAARLRSEYAYDVVLCDLLMPCPPHSHDDSVMPLGPDGEKFVGQEMPFGFPLVFLAAMSGARHVGVVTDASHHNHPFSAVLDPVEWYRSNGAGKFTINGTVVKFFQDGGRYLADGTVCPQCKGTGKDSDHECYTCGGAGKDWKEGKDWGNSLQYLLSDTPPRP